MSDATPAPDARVITTTAEQTTCGNCGQRIERVVGSFTWFHVGNRYVIECPA